MIAARLDRVDLVKDAISRWYDSSAMAQQVFYGDDGLSLF